MLSYLDVKLLGQPEMFIKHDPTRIDDEGKIVNEDTRKFLQGFVDRYADWVRLLKK
ncbi:2-hydroxy-1,4-benzoquinone reductase [Burkholderia multivorans]|nr:2-hydroxy-1,4-benzoquinone reductase [Burkholderia multivorans]